MPVGTVPADRSGRPHGRQVGRRGSRLLPSGRRRRPRTSEPTPLAAWLLGIRLAAGSQGPTGRVRRPLAVDVPRDAPHGGSRCSMERPLGHPRVTTRDDGWRNDDGRPVASSSEPETPRTLASAGFFVGVRQSNGIVSTFLTHAGSSTTQLSCADGTNRRNAASDRSSSESETAAARCRAISNSSSGTPSYLLR